MFNFVLPFNDVFDLNKMFDYNMSIIFLYNTDHSLVKIIDSSSVYCVYCVYLILYSFTIIL